MCGIIGILSHNEVTNRLVDGLKRLEYRGYDSAGIATLINGKIDRRRAEGKLFNLETTIQKSPIQGTTGIGHTRWATHGIPNETNAHPHSTEKVALVHNGIIENYQSIKNNLLEKGYEFYSDTDTEVIAHLVTYYLNQEISPREAIHKAIQKLEGAFALAIIIQGEHGKMWCARQGSPLAIGYGQEEMYLGSDALALAPYTQKLCYLEDGDWAEISHSDVSIFDHQGVSVTRDIRQTSLTGAMIGKGNHRHFMHKEIYEQPAVIGDTLQAYTHASEIALPKLDLDWNNIPKITMVACGTAFYACFVAKYWFEQKARIPVEIDIASEFRYREGPLPENGLALFVSQSGETADTLAALQYAKSQGQYIVSVVNVQESSIARESDAIIPTLAGPEIGVASTKAFTTQLTVLACMALDAAKSKNILSSDEIKEYTKTLTETPAQVIEALKSDASIEKISHLLTESNDVLYLGRGSSYPLALEGALKLKEISYIHAEGYASGEMKHGPIALIDETVPVIVVAPHDTLFEKTVSNLQEVLARGGKAIVMTDSKGKEALKGMDVPIVELPVVDSFTSPIVYSIPLQLLAYHTAVLKGTDVDQPRNLAKSVTVE